MHISSLKRLELDACAAAAADVIVTHVRKAAAQIVRSAGADLARDTEMEKAALSKALKQDELPDLADLVLKRTPGRRLEKDVTLFLNYMGLGYQFAATGHSSGSARSSAAWAVGSTPTGSPARSRRERRVRKLQEAKQVSWSHNACASGSLDSGPGRAAGVGVCRRRARG